MILKYLRAACCLLCLLPLAARAQSASTEAYIYRNVTVIDGTGAAPQPGQDILVQGERIVAIATHGTLPTEAMAHVRVVDLPGRFVMPGLIDSHVHMATPPNRVQAEAMLRRNLYGGVTAVRDMADDLRAVAELARAARQVEIPAPDIYYAALVAGRPFFADPRVGAASKGFEPGTAPWMQAIDDRTDLRTAITLARGTGATAIKIYADLPPHLVAAVTREAHRQKIMVWAHSAVFPTRPAKVIAAAPDSVSHVCYLAYQAQPVMLAAYEDRTPVNEAMLAPEGDDPVMVRLYQEMLRKGTILDATGSLFVQFDAIRKAHPERKPLRCTGPTVIRLTQQAWRAGVAISTGTDHVAGPEALWPDVYEELFFLARDVGMAPLEVIRSATLIGARAAGQDKDMGSIEPGKLANFLVLGKDPSADIRNVRSLEITVKRGRAYPRQDYRPVTKVEMGDGDD
ncbi:amidohydrolase family protein [Sphingobium sp. BYY-5]|uniref:amidohydrolase family protein n=1 Tax=Sphingobium sp. BYY-5 TaxID=2926400 RepID=UPI001FA72ACC|nr:amidohydrolase family protein [Sphingobium sp. BYY-5]MCI4591925.1 amidohydrolase family protein [Sphingobium sp. BYY-5]